jgi:transcriptional regulator with XRE-family HTH domain
MTPVNGAPADRDAEQSRLGTRLKEMREYLGFSQQYVSDRTGIPRTAISEVERGGRKVDSLELKKLAQLYRIPVGYFLDEDVEADAGDHAVTALARKLGPLTEADQEQVLRFAQFLKFAKAAEQEAPPDQQVQEGQ